MVMSCLDVYQYVIQDYEVMSLDFHNSAVKENNSTQTNICCCISLQAQASGLQIRLLLIAVTSVFHTYQYDFHKISGSLELCNQVK